MRLTKREKMIAGAYSNDGVLYSNDQWNEARKLLDKKLGEDGHYVCGTVALTIVGSLTAFGLHNRVIGEYFMRDLVRGIVRDDDRARREYQEAVDAAGLVL